MVPIIVLRLLALSALTKIQKVVSPYPDLLRSVLRFLPFYGEQPEARASVIFPDSRMESWVRGRTRRLRRPEITSVSCGSEVGHATGRASEKRLDW